MKKQEQIIKMRPILDGVCCEKCMIDNIADSLVNAGYGNIEQSLVEFSDYLDCEIIEHSYEFTEQSYDAARRILKNTLHEFLNSLNNKKQGEN